LEAERENLRVAIAWSIETDEVAIGWRLSGALRTFWELRGYSREGQQYLARLLKSPIGLACVRERAYALLNAAALALHVGGYSEARNALQESLAIHRQLGREETALGILNALGIMALCLGDREGSVALHAECLQRARGLGQEGDVAEALHGLTNIARYDEDWERAATLCDQVIALYRRLSTPVKLVTGLSDRGLVAIAQGDLDRAVICYRECLALCLETGNLSVLSWCFIGCAGIALVRRRPVQTTRLLAVAAALLGMLGETLHPVDRADYERYLATVRARLEGEQFETEWAAGEAMSREEAIACATEQLGPIPA
jgi:tetratricopeptide (TPR) repeat protein